jgi:acyl-CoA thioester hydrolase
VNDGLLDTGGRTVPADWIDYNGHMMDAYYFVAFTEATEAMLDHLGLGAAYRERANRGMYTVESHLCFRASIRAGARLNYRSQLLAADSKRLHVLHQLLLADTGAEAATNELMFLHVDLASERVTPFPPDRHLAVVTLAGEHGGIAVPAVAGRGIAMPARTPPAAPEGEAGAATHPEGVLVTGVYGSGKSSVAAEVASLLEAGDERYALLDLDYLSWASPSDHSRPGEVQFMLQNLVAVTANYLEAGIDRFVLAYFLRDLGELAAVRSVLPFPLRVVRLELPLAEIRQRLTGDVTGGRQDDLRAAEESIAAGHGVGLEDIAVLNDRSVQQVAREVMTFAGWL